jgi:EamA domain-containing membrane protein RarD
MILLHIGDHSRVSLQALGLHLLEADHLFFMALTLAVGWGAYRYGRKVEVRAQVVRKDIRS